MRMNYTAPVRLALSVVIGRAERLPSATKGTLDLPVILLDPAMISAAQRVEIALDCALGLQPQLAGAFIAC